MFYDRYEAKRNFDKLRQGEINVKGGWRLYSSGPGLYLSILLNNMLGVRRYHNDLVIDPCLDTRFNDKNLNISLMIICLILLIMLMVIRVMLKKS